MKASIVSLKRTGPVNWATQYSAVVTSWAEQRPVTVDAIGISGGLGGESSNSFLVVKNRGSARGFIKGE